jgi:hypothetical protein
MDQEEAIDLIDDVKKVEEVNSKLEESRNRMRLLANLL